MATSEERYYNDVVKRESIEEKGEKSKLLALRGKIPFQFHAEGELPPPLPPSRTSTLRFQTPLHPVTHSSPRVTNRTLTRRRQEEEDSFESDKTEAGISMASMASDKLLLHDTLKVIMIEQNTKKKY